VKSTVSGNIAFQTLTTLLVNKVFLAPSALVLSSSFFYRSDDAWNYLPSNIKLSTSRNYFKSAIKLCDLSAFLNCWFFKSTLSYCISLLSVLLCCTSIYGLLLAVVKTILEIHPPFTCILTFIALCLQFVCALVNK